MDVAEIKANNPGNDKRIDNMARREKTAEHMLDLKEHGAIQDLCAELEQKITAINVQLWAPKSMTEADRDILIETRECWTWLLDKFPLAEQALLNIEKTLSKLR